MKTSSNIFCAVGHTSKKYVIKIFKSWCKNHFGGVARVSLLDLNAVKIIKRTGKKYIKATTLANDVHSQPA